jgi:hypothetical protein
MLKSIISNAQKHNFQCSKAKFPMLESIISNAHSSSPKVHRLLRRTGPQHPVEDLLAVRQLQSLRRVQRVKRRREFTEPGAV